MMTSKEIRQTFLDFFASKQHKIVPSAPIVSKNDPTLLFTNSGMVQFKDYFLGNQTPSATRIADTQKCMRVSGKHNDLEDVGRDGTHHTMFEMLGNWSFGDYFKKEAINWSWELLTEVYQLPKDRLYATVFGGEAKESLPSDEEARNLWRQYLPDNHILDGNKKDNFWEMGETGPCGPCSEIHVDLRSDAERAETPGEKLVNQDHPRVIEIWNNVFIQFNRKADGALDQLPDKHVDTGMGFERLCMVLQGKTATYDTDVFTPMIQFIEKASRKTYTYSYAPDAMSDIAMRVIVDHIRAVAFAIADGQLPDNGGAGYVIRRILRRAVRYYYSFLELRAPFMHTLLPVLVEVLGDAFPELKSQQSLIAKIIEAEETAFLNTLENGLRRFDVLEVKDGLIQGQDAFDLYDTFGFPIDLTRLMAAERGWRVDEAAFEKALAVQKSRSRADAQKAVGDWNIVTDEADSTFVGYDQLVVEGAKILKYRTVVAKGQEAYQVVLSQTPFYAQSGGQAGDTGWLHVGDEIIEVLDTLKETDLAIQLVKKLPKNFHAPVHAEVDGAKRLATSGNHSAVHLMHAALHRVLGSHALQKGQDVDPERLRFDFSHFQKVTAEELERIETMVNEKIRENIALEEVRNMPIAEAKATGAMMLFGEKYGDTVRVITFGKDYSVELCGGTHVPATGKIGLFKITSEGAVAAGIRRIEALTAENATNFVKAELAELEAVRAIFKNPKNTAQSVAALMEENRQLRKEVEKLMSEQAGSLKDELVAKAETLNDYRLLVAKVILNDANAIKTLAYQLEKDLGESVIVLGAVVQDKPLLTVIISKGLVESRGLHAGNMVRELAKAIDGGGGGQAFFATAGGKNSAGLDTALGKVKELLINKK
ncbi:MAG: alanine--tRNA ligase [Saprospiraceae bacterium]|nr:alanine--tRNA ligase [Saprospiraceae bacterium]MDZ4705686.1 alanine--tRNA ligase [Saprospiraceae bacterium]